MWFLLRNNKTTPPPKKTTQSAYSQCCRSSHDYKKLSPDFKALGKKSAPLDWVRGLVITKLMSLAGQDINLIPCCWRPWMSLYTPQPHCGLLGLVFTTSPLRGIIIHFIYAQLEKDFPFHELFFITCMTKLETITLRSLKFAGQKI